MDIINARLGDVVRIGITPTPIRVTDPTGALVDPMAITISFLQPDGMQTDPVTPDRDASGEYHYDYDPPVTSAMAGMHYWRIVTSGPDAELEGRIYYSPSRFVP
jgi:hypothetical protein